MEDLAELKNRLMRPGELLACGRCGYVGKDVAWELVDYSYHPDGLIPLCLDRDACVGRQIQQGL